MGGRDVQYVLLIFQDTADITTFYCKLGFFHLQAENSGRFEALLMNGVVSEVLHGPVGVNLVRPGDEPTYI